ncbi:hydrogenase maturation protease [Acidobacteria bacterium AB60]|nr:hydrogenase maturation protease [Acidobacteria bacterium AB60]
MSQPKIACLILACGNTLRGDDGVGPWLADWAEEHFGDEPRVHIISRQQWTPDLAADLAGAETVLFLDCSVESIPGEIKLRAIEPAQLKPGIATHHTGAAELLALARELYGAAPRNSLLLTIGAGSTEFGETFSPVVAAAMPEVQRLLRDTLSTLLG